jgi:subtilase family serine protease
MRRGNRNLAGVRLEGLESRQLMSAASSFGPATLVESPNFDLVTKSAVTNSTPFGYTPAQIDAAYGFNSISFDTNAVAGKGVNQTIAIIDAYADPNIASDLATFDSTFGVAALDGSVKHGTFSVVKMSSNESTDTGWAMEESLDVEWAHAIAPKANIVLVEAKSASLSDLLSAVNYAKSLSSVSVISMSWGGSEFSTETQFDSIFTTPASHTPITYVASAGDSGAGVEWPAASPNVLSVGGSSLQLATNGSVISDTGWDYGSGGISAYELKPSYQSGDTLSSKYRTVPDVSYNADPNYGYAIYDSEGYGNQSGWFEVGGTSAGAPQWAALVSIADQNRSYANLPTLNGATQTLPMVYAATGNAFKDITKTNSGGTAYAASKGYDLVSGIGDPHAATVIQSVLS